ncbi:unnamed protein product, partial [Ectocarpus sp. 8 AP-2014]
AGRLLLLLLLLLAFSSSFLLAEVISGFAAFPLHSPLTFDLGCCLGAGAGGGAASADGGTIRWRTPSWVAPGKGWTLPPILTAASLRWMNHVGPPCPVQPELVGFL